MDSDSRHVLLVAAAKGFLKEASLAAQGSDPRSSTWRFYQGVKTAALHVLHPDIAVARGHSSWLADEETAFRDGFRQATGALAQISLAPVPPSAVRMPAAAPEPALVRPR